MPRKQVNIKNSGVLPRTGYSEVLSKIDKGGFCPFCKEHLFKHHTKPILLKNKSWVVTENAWPYEGARKHFLFITQRHVEDTMQLTSAEWSDLKKLYTKLVRTHNLPAATLFLRSGVTEYTGASVRHLHAQLVTGSRRSKTTTPITALIGFGKKK